MAVSSLSARGEMMERTHSSWQKMHNRCSNPKATQWQWYGARDIRVCERWASFENFVADMGRRPDGMTLDRIDRRKR